MNVPKKHTACLGAALLLVAASAFRPANLEAKGPAGKASQVLVVNEPGNPVYVQGVSQPFQQRCVVLIGAGTLANGLTSCYVPPVGTRATIEFVTAQLDTLDSTDSLAFESLSTDVGGKRAWHFIGVLGPEGRQGHQGLAKEVRVYADAEQPVGVGFSRLTRLGDTYVTITLSGHLVNIE